MNLGEFKKLLETSPDDTDLSQYFPTKEVTKVIIPEMATDIPVEGAVANIKHCCNPGDIIASMAACKKYHELTGRLGSYRKLINQRCTMLVQFIQPLMKLAVMLP